MGHLADENGWDLVVKDMHNLTKLIKEEHPNTPVFLFGHSMGSLLSRDFISKFGNEISGTILSGTSSHPGPIAKFFIIIAKIQSFFAEKESDCPFLNNLLFSNYNSQFEPNRTDFDWLSRDQSEVDKYIEDPYCGQIASAGFFIDLFKGLEEIHREKIIDKVPKGLPILLVSGGRDPVGKSKTGVMEVYNLYEEAGIDHLSYKFYEDARHELLHETNREKVFKDIIDWIDSHL